MGAVGCCSWIGEAEDGPVDLEGAGVDHGLEARGLGQEREETRGAGGVDAEGGVAVLVGVAGRLGGDVGAEVDGGGERGQVVAEGVEAVGVTEVAGGRAHFRHQKAGDGGRFEGPARHAEHVVAAGREGGDDPLAEVTAGAGDEDHRAPSCHMARTPSANGVPP